MKQENRFTTQKNNLKNKPKNFDIHKIIDIE